ncbi:ABC transporter permease [Aggregicoccus sp. 17bor-14]|uniref:ABC transporter permease n=1 Tax=Myxococcaceae TaxID=31 RepID=UPI00129C46F8|nr:MULTISPECIES: ABC transporter permease [Myxococcaceae]MBF5045678.1 ABC transporter permease [Simulacricoccus sp. 17bor-14]MRI91415.1 ABC transporter permease [Aggregicoccus sp. 17bor-14]
MSTFLQDLRYALRLLRQAPGFTLAAVLALALGIGATTALFSVVHAVLLRPLPYADAERLVIVTDPSAQPGSQRYSLFERDELARGATQLSSLTAYSNTALALTGLGDAQQVRGVLTDGPFFEVFGVQAELGRTLDPRTPEAPEVVVSHSFWAQQLGGSPQALGRTLTLSGQPYTLVGVMPDTFAVPNTRAQLWLTQASTPNASQQAARTSKGWRAFQLTGRLAPGASLASAGSELAALGERLAATYPDTQGDLHLGAASLHEATVGNVRLLLWVLLGAVGFVLLLAASNVAHLQLARAAVRQKELAIRIALGASRGRLVRQLLTESVLLALLGCALGLLLALWGTDALVALAGRALPRAGEVGMDGRVLLFALATAVATGVGVGLVPALQRSQQSPQASLGRGSAEAFRGRTHGVLVVAEVALALVLVLGAGLMLKSFYKLQQVDPGVDAEGIYTGRLNLTGTRYQEDAALLAFQQQLLARLAARPEVAGAGLGLSVPAGADQRGNSYRVEGTPENLANPPQAITNVVSPGFLETLRVPLRAGRLLQKSDDVAGAPQVIVVSEAFVRAAFPDQDPLGKRISMGQVEGKPDWYTVVGVVGDVAYDGLDTAPGPTLYQPSVQSPYRAPQLVVRAAGGMPVERLAGVMREELRALDPSVPLGDEMTLEAMLARGLGAPRFRTLLLGVFGALALVLAAVGIYGVMSYAVAQRAHEMGVRMALGAQRRDLLSLVVGQSLRRVGLGLAVGLALALAAHRSIAGLLFGVGALDPAVFASVPALLAGVAFVASWLPARRAAGVDPAVVLRRG